MPKRFPVSVITLAPSGHSQVLHMKRKLSEEFEEVLVIESNTPITDFSAARNRAIKQAHCNWILMLDLDEEIQIPNKNAFMQFLTQKNIIGKIRRTDVFYGQLLTHGELARQWPIRLFRKEAGRYQGQVHEVFESDAQVRTAPAHIIHSAHSSVSEFISSVARYAEIAAQTESSSQLVLLGKLATLPLGKFVYTFLILSGWRDGWRGFCYSVCMSLHSLWVRVIAWEKFHTSHDT